MTNDPRTKLGTQWEGRALFSFRPKVGTVASRVIQYLNQIPAADPRLR